MNDFEIRIATEKDVPALVSLANQYTFQNLPEPERQQGFLTGVFSETVMLSMIGSAPCMVTYYQKDLAGFIINTKLPSGKYPPLVQEIIKILPSLTFQNVPVDQYSYFFYGPVLITKKYRNNGLMRQMFQKTKTELKSLFNLGIAFIDEANQASYQVHTKYLGLEVIGSLTFNNRPYNILAFSLI